MGPDCDNKPDSPSDTVERVELADRLELVLEIAKHETNEAFRLAALVARGVASLNCRDSQRARNRHATERGRDEPCHLAVPPGRVALNEFIETDSEHSRDELEEARAPVVGAAAQVGRKRLGPLGGPMAAPIVFVAECGRETFLVFPARACRSRTARRTRLPPGRNPRGEYA